MSTPSIPLKGKFSMSTPRMCQIRGLALSAEFNEVESKPFQRHNWVHGTALHPMG